MYDLLVKNGRIVTAQAVTEGNIGIKDGRPAGGRTGAGGCKGD